MDNINKMCSGHIVLTNTIKPEDVSSISLLFESLMATSVDYIKKGVHYSYIQSQNLNTDSTMPTSSNPCSTTKLKNSSKDACNIELTLPSTIPAEAVGTWISSNLSSCLSFICSSSWPTLYKANLRQNLVRCQALLDFTWQELNTGNWKDVPIYWRYVYTWTSICLVHLLMQDFLSCATLIRSETVDDLSPKFCLTYSVVKKTATAILRAADMGLLMGAPLEDSPLTSVASTLNSLARLENSSSLQSFLEINQTKNMKDSISANDAPIIENLSKELLKCPIDCVTLPPITSFFINHIEPKVPVKLLNIIDEWPAVKKWSFSYLREIAGARTVPIEVGSRYTDEDWSQELMTIDNYLQKFLESDDSQSTKTVYLAQHELLEQIPELKEDIRTPDYCHCGTEEPRINAWIGPKGTVSPLHHDPDNNIFAQVVGFKYIKLFPESETPYLYPHQSGTLLHNTSEVDVEGKDVLVQFPEFAKAKHYDVIVGPGECLFIPPGCWHYVRSLTPSFSVSFWWK